jgi:hypothetical protein
MYQDGSRDLVMNVYQMLEAMLFTPHTSDYEVNARMRARPRAVRVVGSKRVVWADPPDPAKDYRYENERRHPAIARLNQEAYDRDWPTLVWKTFKRLRNLGLVMEEGGVWVPTSKAYEHYRDVRADRMKARRLQYPFLGVRYQSALTRYRRQLARRRKRYSPCKGDLPAPNRKELQMVREGGLWQAYHAYRKRCGIKPEVYGVLEHLKEYYEEHGQKIAFPRRRGWLERVKDRRRNTSSV